MKKLFGMFVLMLVAIAPAANAANCDAYTTYITLMNGHTANASDVMSNFNAILNCANNGLAGVDPFGTNSNIHSLTGLTTPLSVSQGGTGTGTLAAHGVVVGQGSSAVSAAGPSSATGYPLLSNGSSSDPSFAASGVTPGSYTNANISVSAGGLVTAASNGSGASGTPVLITSGSFSNVAEGQIHYIGAWSTYSVLEIYIFQINPVSNNVSLVGLFQDNTGTDVTSLYQWEYQETTSNAGSASGHSASDSSFTALSILGNGNNPYGNGHIKLTVSNSSSGPTTPFASIDGTYYTNSAYAARVWGTALNQYTNTANGGVSFKASTGNISFAYRVYGYP